MDSSTMHYRPWIQHQQMITNQYHPYHQYTLHNMQYTYAMNDHHEENYDYHGQEIPSETCDDQGHNPDVFQLAFAASQWSKLVLNAEGLFHKLMSSSALPPNEQYLLKNQIEQWLCMKQEYEECIAGDDSVSLQGYVENTRRSLERIEEVTETDERTDDSNNWVKPQSQNQSFSSTESDTFNSEDSEHSDQSNETDTDFENSNFIDNLEECMKKFRIDTNELLDLDNSDCLKSINILPNPELDSDDNFVPVTKPVTGRRLSDRRNSIFSSGMSNPILEFQKQNSNINIQQNVDHNSNSFEDLSSLDDKSDLEDLNTNFDSNKFVDNIENTTLDSEDMNTIKTLRVNIQKKQSQLKKIESNLQYTEKQIEELQNLIKIKEKFIEDMSHNSNERNNVKQKFKEKQNKIEEKYKKISEELYKKTVHRGKHNGFVDDEEIEENKTKLIKYEKKLRDIKLITQSTSDLIETFGDIKESVNESKKQIGRFNQELKENEEQKQLLENELIDSHKKIKEIEEKYNTSISKMKTVSFEAGSNSSVHKCKTKCNNREDISYEDLCHDTLLRNRIELQRSNDVDKKESLREEIQCLRNIKDMLIEIKCKYTSGALSATARTARQILIIDENIETIDEIMEVKNVMICSKTDYDENKCNKFDEQILNRVEKLSQKELLSLFHKYFFKVVDLKDSSRNLEKLNARLEDALKRMKTESDMQMMRLGSYYEKRINQLYAFFAEETNSSSYDTKFHHNHEYEKLKQENERLRQRVAYFETVIKGSRTLSTATVRPPYLKAIKPSVKQESMQPALPPPKTTKITRQRNKLILQTQVATPLNGYQPVDERLRFANNYISNE